VTATLAQIREGLAANLSAIPNVQVSAYMLSSPTPPTLWVFPEETDFDLTMQRGLDCYHLTIQAYIGAVADEGSQVLLDTLLDPASATSVKAAVEADRTLGGAVESLRVTKQTGYRLYQVPNMGHATSMAQILGCEWTVEVYT